MLSTKSQSECNAWLFKFEMKIVDLVPSLVNDLFSGAWDS